MILITEGLVPGVLYGEDDDRNVLKQMILVEQKMLMKELRLRGKSFENTLYELSIDADDSESSNGANSASDSAMNPSKPMKILATARQTQFHPCMCYLI